MTLLRTFQAGTPPLKVILLPDGVFFTRTIPIPPASTALDVTAQVELALETLSPFPPAQLYHGYFWPPGAEFALVFAAYRRRFTNEQLEGWENAELVMPSFAALLGGDIRSETTLIIPSAEGLTALYFAQSPVPTKVVFRAMQPDATEADWTRAREQLAASVPTNRAVVVNAPPVAIAAPNDRELAFQAEAFTSRLPLTVSSALDVRDKEALAGLRRARNRDLALWRGFLAIVALLFLLGVGEFLLLAAAGWSRTRLTQIAAQRPVVERIMLAQSVTTRIN